jgi:hypothetical protein
MGHYRLQASLHALQSFCRLNLPKMNVKSIEGYNKVLFWSLLPGSREQKGLWPREGTSNRSVLRFSREGLIFR